MKPNHNKPKMTTKQLVAGRYTDVVVIPNIGQKKNLWKAKDTKNENLNVVIKGPWSKENVVQEICILSLYLPDIVGISRPIDTFKSYNNDGSETAFMVTKDYGQDMFNTLIDDRTNKGMLDEKFARHIILELAHTLKAIHSKGVAHMDVAAENICLSEVKGTEELPQVTLIDFGQSIHKDVVADHPDYTWSFRENTDHWTVYTTRPIGRDRSLTPEMFYQCGFCPYKQDVYGLGIVAYMLLMRQIPCEKFNDEYYRVFRSRLAHQTHCSPEAINFVLELTAENADLRPLITQVCEHPWLKISESNTINV